MSRARRPLRRVLIAGPSMSPTLEVGDVVIVREGARPRCGDVIVFESHGAPICHRAMLVVPWWDGWRVVHRGDARGAGLGVTGGSAVIGRVESMERGTAPSVSVPRRRPKAGEVVGSVRFLLRTYVRTVRGSSARAS